MEPCATQIVDLSSEGKVVPNEEALGKILLQPNVKDKQVCVISITGTFRQGKSFLLNFLVRYLRLKYQLKKPVDAHWLDPADGNMSGFPWRCGSHRHTLGILMWSEVYLAELPSGEEIAIVLLDTQGTFDNVSTKQECADVFAMSTLISSVQIYNLKDKINQFDLEHLECFSGYGQLLRREDPKFEGTPFQNLWFLIRDWQYQFEKSFGRAGGRELLREIFDSNDQPSEIKKQTENIRSLFETIDCFLMPHPGEKVARKPSFQGALQDVSPVFRKYVEEFVIDILAPENLVPKKINGRIVKGSDLFHFIQDYCKFFADQELPQLKSMFMVTAETNLKLASEEAEMIYQNAMDSTLNTSRVLTELELRQKHVEERAKAVLSFSGKKLFGGGGMKLAYMEKLYQTLDEKFLVYETFNKVKCEKKRQLYQQNQRHQKQREEMKCEFEKVKQALEWATEAREEELRRYHQSAKSSKEGALPRQLQERIDRLNEPGPSKKRGKWRDNFFMELLRIILLNWICNQIGHRNKQYQ